MPVVDLSMYNSKGIDPGQLADGYEQGVKIKDMQQQQQLRGIQIQQATAAQNVAQQDLAFQKKLAGIAQTDPTTGQITYPSGSLAGLTQEFGPQRTMPVQQLVNEQAVKYAQQQGELLHAKLGEKQQLLAAAAESPAAFETAKKTMFDRGYIGMTDPLASMSYEQATAPSDPANPKSGTFLENRASLAGSYQDQIAQRNKAAELANATTTANAAASQAQTAKDKLPDEHIKAMAEAALVGPKFKGELYGRSSPTNAMQQDYEKEVAPIRASQGAMRQMMDNYHNPSPQGDRSLILNAFKIKFPTAPDVNSLEELSKAQSVPEQWRNNAYAAIHGGLDQNTRDNLMRDGVSTYRANYGTYQDVAKRYQGMAQDRGIPLGGMTREPSLDNTFKEAQKLQQKLNPTTGGPKVGSVVNGHVYLGGDPNSQSSWKAQ